jgi:lipopolysaccharide biosynthesis regulator YciM
MRNIIQIVLALLLLLVTAILWYMAYRDAQKGHTKVPSKMAFKIIGGLASLIGAVSLVDVEGDDD